MLPVVANLKPGQAATISHRSPTELNQRKYLLYAWLSPLHSNKKELYKFITLSPLSFQVIRRHGGPAVIKVEDDQCSLFVIEHLLDIVDPKVALEVIKQNCANVTLQEEIYNEWMRKTGISK